MIATLNIAPTPNAPPARRPLRPSLLIATVGGLGYAPLAPGTWGAGAGLLLFCLLAPLGATAFWLALATTLLVGIPAATAAEHHFGHADDGRIVIDEVAGQLLGLAPLVWMDPARSTDPLALAVAFLLFRALDIWKPGPVRWTERRFQGGFGVIADDLVAGALTAGPVWLVALAAGPGATP